MVGSSPVAGYLYDLATPNCKIALLALALLVLGTIGCISAPDYTKAIPAGPARVIDGDSLEVAGEVVRIHGIDAPELAQACERGGRAYPCGRMARQALAALTAAPVACSGRRRGKYGRRIAACSSGGLDLGAAMVASGWALAYRRYSTAYVELEAEARAAKRGLWAGGFTAPADWRRRKK